MSARRQPARARDRRMVGARRRTLKKMLPIGRPGLRTPMRNSVTTLRPTVVPEMAETMPIGTRKPTASAMARTRHQIGVCQKAEPRSAPLRAARRGRPGAARTWSGANETSTADAAKLTPIMAQYQLRGTSSYARISLTWMSSSSALAVRSHSARLMSDPWNSATCVMTDVSAANEKAYVMAK